VSEINTQAQNYWDAFWNRKEKPKSVSAWQFGGNPDELAKLVMDGVKTATCSGHVFYEIEREPLPKVDDYSIVLNSSDEPVCIIRTTEVTICPLNKVSEVFAYDEGEGDRSYDYWKSVHVQFFRKALIEVDLEFSEDMLLVCERFELINVK
jgi:uncharacterized protein YhfF